jgi:fused signal recognition particle receptor
MSRDSSNVRLFRTKGERKTGFWSRLKALALADVRVLSEGLDQQGLEELEERLLGADFGVKATLRLVGHVEDLARAGRVRDRAGLERALREEVTRIFDAANAGGGLAFNPTGSPTVYLIVGVNGVGKTTSAAKLAHHLIRTGRSVLIGAGDTHRAGAVQQLETWASRVGADFVRGQEGGDPAAVAFDAVDAGIRRGVDVVLVDTAGRLHTNRGLMEELGKVERVVRRKLEGAPHETLIVLDATVGQNALSQVAAFREKLALTGIVLAKMDSTAKGGIVVALAEEHRLPVKLVGVGEAVSDLEPFDAGAFLDGIFEGP